MTVDDRPATLEQMLLAAFKERAKRDPLPYILRIETAQQIALDTFLVWLHQQSQRYIDAANAAQVLAAYRTMMLQCDVVQELIFAAAPDAD